MKPINELQKQNKNYNPIFQEEKQHGTSDETFFNPYAAGG